jgi:hypothetical protein
MNFSIILAKDRDKVATLGLKIKEISKHGRFDQVRQTRADGIIDYSDSGQNEQSESTISPARF